MVCDNGYKCKATVTLYEDDDGNKKPLIRLKNGANELLDGGDSVIIQLGKGEILFFKDRFANHMVTCNPQEILAIHLQIKGFLGRINLKRKRLFPKYLLSRHRLVNPIQNVLHEDPRVFRVITEDNSSFQSSIDKMNFEDIPPCPSRNDINRQFKKSYKNCLKISLDGTRSLNRFFKPFSRRFHKINNFEVLSFIRKALKNQHISGERGLSACLMYPFNMPRYRNSTPLMYYPDEGPVLSRERFDMLKVKRSSLGTFCIFDTTHVEQTMNSEIVWAIVFEDKSVSFAEFWAIVLPTDVIQNYTKPHAFTTVALIFSTKFKTCEPCVVMLCENEHVSVYGDTFEVFRWIRVAQLRVGDPVEVKHLFWGLVVKPHLSQPIPVADRKEILSPMPCIQIQAKNQKASTKNCTVSVWASDYGTKTLILTGDRIRGEKMRFDFTPMKTLIQILPDNSVSFLRDEVITPLIIKFKETAECIKFVRRMQSLDNPSINSTFAFWTRPSYEETILAHTANAHSSNTPEIGDPIKLMELVARTFNGSYEDYPGMFEWPGSVEAFFAENDNGIRKVLQHSSTEGLDIKRTFFYYEVPFHEPHRWMNGGNLDEHWKRQRFENFPMFEDIPPCLWNGFFKEPSPNLKNCPTLDDRQEWIYQVEYLRTDNSLELGISPILVHFPVYKQLENMSITSFATKGLKFDFVSQRWEIDHFFLATCERTGSSPKDLWWLRIAMPKKNPVRVCWAFKLIAFENFIRTKSKK